MLQPLKWPLSSHSLGTGRKWKPAWFQRQEYARNIHLKWGRGGHYKRKSTEKGKARTRRKLWAREQGQGTIKEHFPLLDQWVHHPHCRLPSSPAWVRASTTVVLSHFISICWEGEGRNTGNVWGPDGKTAIRVAHKKSNSSPSRHTVKFHPLTNLNVRHGHGTCSGQWNVCGNREL